MENNPNVPTELEEKLRLEAEAEAQQQALEEMIASQIQTLYSMNCFDTIPDPTNTFPMVCRVPGGWIFYTRSGGMSLKMKSGKVTDNTIVGNPLLVPIFIPFHSEFLKTSS